MQAALARMVLAPTQHGAPCGGQAAVWWQQGVWRAGRPCLGCADLAVLPCMAWSCPLDCVHAAGPCAGGKPHGTEVQSGAKAVRRGRAGAGGKDAKGTGPAAGGAAGPMEEEVAASSAGGEAGSSSNSSEAGDTIKAHRQAPADGSAYGTGGGGAVQLTRQYTDHGLPPAQAPPSGGAAGELQRKGCWAGCMQLASPVQRQPQPTKLPTHLPLLAAP